MAVPPRDRFRALLKEQATLAPAQPRPDLRSERTRTERLKFRHTSSSRVRRSPERFENIVITSTNFDRPNRLVKNWPFRPRRHRRAPGDFGSLPGYANRWGALQNRLLPQLGDPTHESHAPCVRSQLRQRRSVRRREPPLHRREEDRMPLLLVATGPAGEPARRRRPSREAQRQALPW